MYTPVAGSTGGCAQGFRDDSKKFIIMILEAYSKDEVLMYFFEVFIQSSLELEMPSFVLISHAFFALNIH